MSNRPAHVVIQGNDGFYVSEWREHGAYWLCAGHSSALGGLFGEWSDCETDRDRHSRARRMIARARRDHPALRAR